MSEECCLLLGLSHARLAEKWELDNRTPGKVTGWMRFFRQDEEPFEVTFDLEGDFHEDIRGQVIPPCPKIRPCRKSQ